MMFYNKTLLIIISIKRVNLKILSQEKKPFKSSADRYLNGSQFTTSSIQHVVEEIADFIWLYR